MTREAWPPGAWAPSSAAGGKGGGAAAGRRRAGLLRGVRGSGSPRLAEKKHGGKSPLHVVVVVGTHFILFFIFYFC